MLGVSDSDINSDSDSYCDGNSDDYDYINNDDNVDDHDNTQ